MKVFITLLFSILLHTASAQYKLADSITKKYKDVFPSNLSGYYFVRNKKEKTGLIDSVGNVQIKPMFEYIGNFEKGRAESGNNIGNKMKRGIIDFSGNIVVPFMYDNIFRYTAENSIVTIGKKNGVIDSTNKILIPIKYEYITSANENILIVKENNKYGFIGENGKAITKNIYKDVDRFYDKKATIILEDNSGTVINTEGKELFKAIKNINFTNVKQDLLIAINTKTKKYGVFNDEGKQIITSIYDEIEIYVNNIKVKKNDKYGLLDRDNKIKIPIEYEGLYYRENNNFICTKQKFYGVINTKNEYLIPLKYGDIDYLEQKYYFARNKDSLSGVFDLNGKEILPLEYKIYGNCNGKIFTRKNNNCFVIDLENINNKTLLEIDSFKANISTWYFYDECSQIAIKNKMCGVIDIENKIEIPFKYDDIRKLYFNRGYVVKQNGKYGIVDSNNKIIQNIIYDNIIQQKEAINFYINGKRVKPTP
jgi:WG containing repeat